MQCFKIKDDSIIDKPNSKGKITREEALILREKEKSLKNRINYAEFVDCLLDFQLKGHEEYLKKFVKLFKKIDSNSDGVINEIEFKRLISGLRIGSNNEYCNRLLQIIDPFDNQKITFSECVTLFSSELVPGENIPIMKKLSEIEI